MPRLKDETLSIRTSAQVKQLLKMAAEREHRSVASMMEVLVFKYAEEAGLMPDNKKNKAGEGACNEGSQ